MRWDELKVEAEEGRQLPGYRDEAVVRRFDAPEALDTRFYEVRAKSALNRVPEQSQVPFKWTINPYRGCSHACVYCVSGDAEILLPDGGTKPLAEIKAGERIFGTRRTGTERRYVPTEVLAHWRTTKPAHRVTLANGVQLTASGDHRFLTEDGWKYVTPQEEEGTRRAHLSVGECLLGADQSAADAAVTTDPGRCIVQIEPLGGEMELFDITTGTGDFIANGVVSHNCFARPTHKYLDMNAGRDFEKEIVVKVNVPEVLRAELKRPSWKREHIAMGTNTDPYQWVEGRYKLMPPIWEALRDFANPCSILTKSPLVMRDLALLKEVNERAPVHANFSVPTLDEKMWRATEPHTPNPRARLEAVGEMNRAGIPCGVLIAPLMPGINDAPEQVEEILDICAEMGAVHVGGIALHLRGDVRRIYMDWLRSMRPDLVPRYEKLYARGAYATRDERARLQRLLGRRKVGMSAVSWRGRIAEAEAEARRQEPPPAETRAEQPSLF